MKQDDKVKEYRVSTVECDWEGKDGRRCQSQAYQTVRLWPDGLAGPFCFHHARVYVAQLEERGYRQRTY